MYLDDFEDSLLIEVLHRLPTTKSAFQCKSVCKKWYSLISSSYFVRRFIAHHVLHHNHHDPFALIVYYNHLGHGNASFTCSEEPMFNSCGFKLTFLPEDRRLIEVVATFNDLILCCVNKSARLLQYYICNPFSMQWVALPPIPRTSFRIRTPVGFVCEPHYTIDAHGECTINSQYRYRVVRIIEVESTYITMEKYCSETGKWLEFVLSGEEYLFRGNFFSFNGKLHWLNGRDIVAYDPFADELLSFTDCFTMKSPLPETNWHDVIHKIGVSRSFLRMMIYSVSTGLLMVWELKDCGTGEWILVHEVHLNALIPISSSSQRLTRQSLCCARPLGFHPSNGDYVYLIANLLIILCNIQTKECKLVGEIPEITLINNKAFLVVLPWWPAPIPALPMECS